MAMSLAVRGQLGEGETIGAQVAVQHCRCSNKKVSAVDLKNQLEIICNRDKLMKSH
jgi:hypothetical protein